MSRIQADEICRANFAARNRLNLKRFRQAHAPRPVDPVVDLPLGHWGMEALSKRSLGEAVLLKVVA